MSAMSSPFRSPIAAGVLPVALPIQCGSYSPWLNQPHFVSSPVRLGTQMTADYPQMLASLAARRNCGGRTQIGKDCWFRWIIFVVVVT